MYILFFYPLEGRSITLFVWIAILPKQLVKVSARILVFDAYFIIVWLGIFGLLATYILRTLSREYDLSTKGTESTGS